MRTDQEIKKDFDEAYKQSASYWSPWLAEARVDLQLTMGDSWTDAEERYLKLQRREVLNFNKTRRIIEMVSGHQIKNRLSLKCAPVEGSDEQTADQMTAIILWIMQYGSIYNEMSMAFKQGALKTGINMVELYVDYSQDHISGDIFAKRLPYNRFLIDPNWSNLDLSDCGYLITRNYMSKSAVSAIIPKDARKLLDEIKPKGRDNKFTDIMPMLNTESRPLYRYDRFYESDYEQFKVLFDKESGKQEEWKLSRERLKAVLDLFPGRFEVIEASRRAINLCVMVEDEVVYKGRDTTGANGYPFVPVVGFYDPEHDEAEWKLQGLGRSLRDPQRQENKRISQMIDIVESQLASGWKAKAGSVVNPEALYSSGQGNVIWMNEKSQLTDTERLAAPNIPPALFDLSNALGSLMMDVGLVNMEMFGETEGGDTQTSGVLSKLRTGAGLTMLQGLFDNFRTAQANLGRKIISMIQSNYTPEKVKLITAEEPTQEFYSKNFGKYDCVPEEGVLTDTQKQMAFIELRSMKSEGLPIPASAIIEASSIQNKDDLSKHAKASEEAAAKNEQMQQQIVAMQMALVQSEIERNKVDVEQGKANIIDKMGEAKASQAQSLLDIIKAIKELQSMDTTQLLEQMRTLQEIALAKQQVQQ